MGIERLIFNATNWLKGGTKQETVLNNLNEVLRSISFGKARIKLKIPKVDGKALKINTSLDYDNTARLLEELMPDNAYSSFSAVKDVWLHSVLEGKPEGNLISFLALTRLEITYTNPLLYPTHPEVTAVITYERKLNYGLPWQKTSQTH